MTPLSTQDPRDGRKFTQGHTCRRWQSQAGRLFWDPSPCPPPGASLWVQFPAWLSGSLGGGELALGLVPGVGSRPCSSRPALRQAAALKTNKRLFPRRPFSLRCLMAAPVTRPSPLCHRRSLVAHRAWWVSQASGASLGAHSHLELVYVGKRFRRPNNSRRKEF